MNTLSWYLYFADVFGRLSLVFFLAGWSFLIFSLLYGAESDKHVLFLISCALVSFFITVVIPSKTTMYAIAASELGEQAYKTELGQLVMKNLEELLQSKLPKGK